MKRAMLGASAIVLGTSAILLTAATAVRAEERIVATVPFEFVVGDAHLPAGGYEITSTSGEPGLMSISSMGGQHFTFVLTIPASPDSTIQEPELTFERLGSEYYLTRIVAPYGYARDIPLSASTKEQELRSVAQGQ
jgi:hypothetical protein